MLHVKDHKTLNMFGPFATSTFCFRRASRSRAFPWQDSQYPTSDRSILTCFVSFAQFRQSGTEECAKGESVNRKKLRLVWQKQISAYRKIRGENGFTEYLQTLEH